MSLALHSAGLAVWTMLPASSPPAQMRELPRQIVLVGPRLPYGAPTPRRRSNVSSSPAPRPDTPGVSRSFRRIVSTGPPPGEVPLIAGAPSAVSIADGLPNAVLEGEPNGLPMIRSSSIPSGFDSGIGSAVFPRGSPPSRTPRVGAFDSRVSSSITQSRPIAELHNGEFGDATVARVQDQAVRNSNGVSHDAVPIASGSTPIEIVSKPHPIYTDEARQAHVQGEVVLEALFSASGEVRVLRVVLGLGHGLDQAAVTATSAIRFKPATRQGVPVDSTTLLHVTFQLAY